MSQALAGLATVEPRGLVVLVVVMHNGNGSANNASFHGYDQETT
jgi:hypothetical protein